MIDHLSLSVSNYTASKAFYQTVLAPLGGSLIMEFGKAGGFGQGGKPSFWIGEGYSAPTPSHVAFISPNRAAVDAFYRAALEAGARDNGAPGIRAHYHPNYYGAFVIDPDGHNIEAVCHAPE
jgi:catechol 2,3-dioxygenase-like lactoylglutathione lyase family enzyme